jgi:hypothetical protein
MDGVLLNQYVAFYLMSYVYEFTIYLTLVNCFNLKVNKKKVFILAVICANLLPLFDTLSLYFIGGGIIPETNEVIFITKLLNILVSILLVGFIVGVFETKWYRCYWLAMILHIVFSLPVMIYFNHFVGYNSQNKIYISPVTTETLSLFLFDFLISIAWGYLFLLLSKFLIKKFIKNINQITKRSWFALYSVWSLLTLNTGKSYTNNTQERTGLLEYSSNFTMILIAIIIIILIMTFSINYADKRLLKVENSLLKEQNEMQYANYLTMQQQEMKIHKLYHDIGNHIRTIQILVNNGEGLEAKNYTDNLVCQYQNINKEFYCSNKIINAVLSHKVKVCEENGISYNIDIQIPDDLPIRDIDLMSVYSNLLDNALEACQRNNITSKYIKVITNVIGDYFTVKVINSKPNDNTFDDNKKSFITWKKDKSMHGYGIRIIKEIIERYDGMKEFIDNGDEFSAMVVLKIM